MALGKQPKTIRGLKPASKMSNSMSITFLSQFPLLNHPTEKVQNSRLGDGLIDSASLRLLPTRSVIDNIGSYCHVAQVTVARGSLAGKPEPTHRARRTAWPLAGE